MNFESVKTQLLDWLQATSSLPNYAWVAPTAIALFLLAVSVLLLRLKKRTTIRWRDQQLATAEVKVAFDKLTERFKHVVDLDDERKRLEEKIAAIAMEIVRSNTTLQKTNAEVEALNSKLKLYTTDLNAIDYGLYQPHFDFDVSQKFKAEIERVRDEQKRLIKDGDAIKETGRATNRNFSKSEEATRKQLKKLILRAFNGEIDSLISNANWSDVQRLGDRLYAINEAISDLVETFGISISSEYVDLKHKELLLNYEYQEKRRIEREEQRRIQAQMREEERAQREIERALNEAKDEEERYAKALERAKREVLLAKDGEVDVLNSRVKLLEEQLAEAQAAKQRAISRAEQTRSGHIYIISNIGSFGQNKFKIGMTRRLDPLERIKELSDASVPFDFDVHAVIFTEDAPTLESRLHSHFSSRRVNRVNERKEFFDVAIEEIEAVIRQYNASIEVIKEPEAREYRETLAALQHGSGQQAGK